MNNVSHLFRPRQQMDLQDLSDKLEADFGRSILEELTDQSLTRKGQRVRLFDQSARSAEAYYPADEQGKPYVQNFQEGRRWYPITAWMENYDIDWKTAVQELAKQYLDTASSSEKSSHKPRKRTAIVPTPKPPTTYHDPALVAATLGHYERNNFAIFLKRLFGISVADELLMRFHVGTCLEGIAQEWARSTVFWQTDQQGRVHSGKVIYYDLAGRRMKEKKSDFSSVFWLHDVMAMKSFILEQCFFGEHQLSSESRTKPIAIVESEKTAVIATAFEPGFIWLACGGLSNLNAQKCKPITGRQVVLFPDLGGFGLWTAKADELQRLGYTVSVSKVLEERATSLERYSGLDIADFLTRYRCLTTGRVLTEPDGYPALWDCEPLNPIPTIKPLSSKE